MAQIKVQELSGAALDWAVAKCEGEEVKLVKGQLETLWTDNGWKPSTNWAQGGPIIERVGLVLAYISISKSWVCHKRISKQFHGPTPLIAAMRCHVASKLGDTIEAPDALIK